MMTGVLLVVVDVEMEVVGAAGAVGLEPLGTGMTLGLTTSLEVTDTPVEEGRRGLGDLKEVVFMSSE